MAVAAPESMGFDASWTKDESLILFQPHLLSRIPRGWERAPTNPFTARLKGHKLWKRYNLRSDRPMTTGAAPASEISGQEDAPEGTGRAVKRLRVGEKRVPALKPPGTDGRSYVGTLWGSSADDKNRKDCQTLRASIGHPLTLRDMEGKIAPRPSARRDELPSISPIGEAVFNYDGEPHGAQGAISEEGLPAHLPQLSRKGENSAGLISVQPSGIEHDDNVVDSTMLFRTRPKRFSGPKPKMTVHHDNRTVRGGRRATIAGRTELARTPRKDSVSPSYRNHPKSAEGKAKSRMSSTMFAQDPVQVTCAAENVGEDPAAGMRRRKEMVNGATEEAVSSEIQDVDSPVMSIPEQDCNTGTGSVTKSRGCDVSLPSADVPFNILDVSMSQVQVSSSVTEPCAEARLGNRLSDDTNMLKDFLHRVKANKAARSVDMSGAVRPVPPSPPKSPRKVLAAVDSNLPSPRRSQEIANRPGTPPGKHTLESSDLDELDDGAVEPTSFRRSARVRLPAPPKPARGTPSLIPVRRPTGSEPVVLQKSIAQELALITRNNTRRNKGRSKPADLTLQALAEEPMQLDLPVKKGRDGAKHVAWDETLVYHLEGMEAKQEEKGKPKMRRLKGLGTANGTPAAKKEVTSAFPYPAGTLGNRRKGRAKA